MSNNSAVICIEEIPYKSTGDFCLCLQTLIIEVSSIGSISDPDSWVCLLNSLFARTFFTPSVCPLLEIARMLPDFHHPWLILLGSVFSRGGTKNVWILVNFDRYDVIIALMTSYDP